MNPSHLSYVFLPRDSGFSWDSTPEIITRVLAPAEVTQEPAMAVSEEDAVPFCARWPDGYELWFFLTRDAREFADDVLGWRNLPDTVRERMAGVSATCDARVEISGDSDSETSDEHFNDWMLATEVFAELPGAVDVDGALLDEASGGGGSSRPPTPPPAEAGDPVGPSEQSAADVPTATTADGPQPWWRRLLG